MKSQRSVEEIQSSMFGTDGSRNENKSYPKAHTGLSPRLGHVWETMAGTQDRREKPPPLRQEPVETRGPLRPSYDARGKPDISLARGLTMAFRQVDAPFTPESAAPARGQANISLARGITVASRQGDVGYAPSSAAPGSQPRPQPKASPEASFYVPPPPASLYVPPPEFTPASRASPAVISPPAPQHAATPPPSRTQPQQQSRPALQNKNAGVGISFVPSEQGKITIAHMVPGAPAAQSGELRVGDQARQILNPLEAPRVHAVKLPTPLRPKPKTLNPET
ncbi:hypothetical protein T484DRAFT_2655045 [Baffinella frigidus]|nr:hypothetical protein T484DRAFT_2655045 [Cryptophyta sp. CCMP2293]